MVNMHATSGFSLNKPNPFACLRLAIDRNVILCILFVAKCQMIWMSALDHVSQFDESI